MREEIDAVLAERQSIHGSAEENFTITGRAWGAILGLPDIPAWKVALMMDFFKTVRCLANPDHADNWIDKAGYTHHAQMIAAQGQVCSSVEAPRLRQGAVVTHDELCPWLDPALANTNNPWCECDLIARVVEREREQAAQRISAADSPPEWVLVIDGDPRPAAAWLMATRMAVAAARGEQA